MSKGAFNAEIHTTPPLPPPPSAAGFYSVTTASTVGGNSCRRAGGARAGASCLASRDRLRASRRSSWMLGGPGLVPASAGAGVFIAGQAGAGKWGRRRGGRKERERERKRAVAILGHMARSSGLNVAVLDAGAGATALAESRAALALVAAESAPRGIGWHVLFVNDTRAPSLLSRLQHCVPASRVSQYQLYSVADALAALDGITPGAPAVHHGARDVVLALSAIFDACVRLRCLLYVRADRLTRVSGAPLEQRDACVVDLALCSTVPAGMVVVVSTTQHAPAPYEPAVNCAYVHSSAPLRSRTAVAQSLDTLVAVNGASPYLRSSVSTALANAQFVIDALLASSL